MGAVLRQEVPNGPEDCRGNDQHSAAGEKEQSRGKEMIEAAVAEHHARRYRERHQAESAEENDVKSSDALQWPAEWKTQASEDQNERRSQGDG